MATSVCSHTFQGKEEKAISLIAYYPLLIELIFFSLSNPLLCACECSSDFRGRRVIFDLNLFQYFLSAFFSLSAAGRNFSYPHLSLFNDMWEWICSILLFKEQRMCVQGEKIYNNKRETLIFIFTQLYTLHLTAK